MIRINLENLSDPPQAWPDVFDYVENIEKLKEEVNNITPTPKNVIAVGNGGSITSFDAFYYALSPVKKSASVWTMDPNFLKKIRSQFTPEDTVVVAVSKSGNTLGQIEALMYFQDFPVICVTNSSQGTLSEIARKKNWNIIEHPPIGGRYSGGTSSTLVGALICGMDIDKLQQGIREGYDFKKEAYSLAKYYFDLEEKGYSEIYVTNYCEALAGFENLIVQLMHESVCKDNKGQTVYFSMGPEAQHHTNQRFIGGKKNVIGTFIVEKNKNVEIKIEVPDELQDIDYKGDRLSIINNLPYQTALKAEYLGTKKDADAKSIPNVTITTDEVNELTVGQMVSFWHLVAFYSSVLRDVDPFDQPAVEDSKNITLNIIKNNS